MISTQNRPTLRAQMLSLEVLFVKLFKTGLRPRSVKKIRPADLTVLGVLTSLLWWEVKSQKM